MLLKNNGDLLPLQPAPGQTIAVIGEFARTPRYQGAGSSQVNPTRVDVPLDELRAGVPDGVEVRFAPGFGLDDSARDEVLAAEAVALARNASSVVLFLGLPDADESEGFDRAHLDLPDAQTALVARLAEVNPRIVVVLANGSVVRLEGWEHHASALLECWLGGQAAGGAVADLLLGVASPSGRLAETLPLRLEDNPSHLNFPGEAGHVRYGEGVFVGYRGYDALRPRGELPLRTRTVLHHLRVCGPAGKRVRRRRDRRPCRLTSASRSATADTAAARRSSSSTSATLWRRWRAPCGSSGASRSSTSPPGRPRGPPSGSAPATCPSGRPRMARGTWSLGASTWPWAHRPATCDSAASVDVTAPLGVPPARRDVDAGGVARRPGRRTDPARRGRHSSRRPTRRHPRRRRAHPGDWQLPAQHARGISRARDHPRDRQRAHDSVGITVGRSRRSPETSHLGC